MRRFDVDPDLIRRLAALLDETGLTEIEVQEDGRAVRVARGLAPAAAVAPVAASPAPMAAAVPAEARADASHPGAVTAPMVGTVYLAPEPGSPAFVREGDRVAQGDTLLIIEAMKVMNRIPAPRAGVVTRILVANEAPVEYGEALLLIE